MLRGRRSRQSTGGSKAGRSSRSGRPRRCSRATSARSRSSAGRARPIRSARPACAKRAPGSCRASSRSSRWSTSTSARSRRTSSSATARSSIEKTCPMHGTFTDTLAINPAFLERLEIAVSRPRLRRGHRHAAQPRHLVDQVRPRRGADDRPDQPLQHDVRPVLHGRQSGRLRPRADARRGQAAARRRGQHQAAAADDGAVLRRRADDLADLPRRGRATPARSATSASRRRPTASASRRTRSSRARRARPGMRIAYLQFDGVSEEANAHRKVGNLFDVKLRAIENLHAAGIDVCLVVTIVNTVNDDQVGPIVKFALAELRQDQLRLVPAGVVHRPRRGHQRRGARTRKRYTLSHLAEDMKRQTGVTEPLRDWFPLSASSAMSRRHRPAEGPGRRLGHAEVRLPSRLRHRHGASWSARRPRSGRRCRRSSTSSASCSDAQVDRRRGARPRR